MDAGIYIDRMAFQSTADAARYFQHAADLRASNARQVRRFGPMHCAQMQREAAALYAKARELQGAV